MKTLKKPLAPFRGIAELRAESMDVEERTFELLFYTGAKVLQFPFFDDPYELSFEVSKKAAKLDRLNNGAPLINSHNSRDLDGQLGVVEKAWLQDDMAHARVRMSRRADVEPIWQDIKDGIIRNVSMGTYILEMEEVPPAKGSTMKQMRATSWEPYEISMVPAGADPGARVLHASADGEESRECVITLSTPAQAVVPKRAVVPKEKAMTIKVRLLATGEIVEIDETDFDETIHSKQLTVDSKKPTTTADDVKAAKRKVDDALELEAGRAAEIKRAALGFGLDKAWADNHVRMGTPIEQVLEGAAVERAKRAPKAADNLGYGDDFENTQWRREQMELALAARCSRKEVPETARQYANFSFVECALEQLSWNQKHRGLDVRADKGRIIELALHSTSDFPLLLANLMQKMLLPAYDAAAPTYRQIAAQKTFNDFRAHNFLRAGDFPVPLLVGENGEYKSGTLSETNEPVSCFTYGRILGISRQIMVNDDAQAFADIATMAGRRSADFENALFYTTCINAAAGLGPTLSAGNGGVAVFNAAHNNLTAGGALSNALLGSARALLMAQTSLDGLKLNTPGRILLVSPTNLTAAETFLAAITPAQASNVNPFAGKLIAVGDANLGTGTRFYVLADPAVLPNYVYGFLGGAAGPRTEIRNGFIVDGIEFKLSLDFGCGAIDYRGGATGAGV